MGEVPYPQVARWRSKPFVLFYFWPSILVAALLFHRPVAVQKKITSGKGNVKKN